MELRNTRARELTQRYLLRNTDRLRQERTASMESDGKGYEEGSLRARACDWGAEAAAVAASEPLTLCVLPSSADAVARRTTFSVTGNPLWQAATEAERLAVVDAFATNAVLKTAEMVNAFAGDAIAQAWGRALATNSTVSALNLESNSISSAGIEALADGVRASGQLRQLKLANQHVNFSQQSELKLADAMEHNTSITSLAIELRSVQARDMTTKYVTRNRGLAVAKFCDGGRRRSLGRTPSAGVDEEITPRKRPSIRDSDSGGFDEPGRKRTESL